MFDQSDDFAARRALVSLVVAGHRLQRDAPQAAQILQSISHVRNHWLVASTNQPLTQQRLNAEYSLLKEDLVPVVAPDARPAMESALQFLLLDLIGGTYIQRLRPLMHNTYSLTGGGHPPDVKRWMNLGRQLARAPYRSYHVEYAAAAMRAHTYRLG